MKISLVLSTLDRVEPLERFFHGLRSQSYRNYEVIIVDQNEDDRLTGLIKQYESEFTIKHVTSPKGLSIARNNGLEHSEGEIIAFPDDDCWYSAEVLQQVVTYLRAHPEMDGISGLCRDDNETVIGNPSPTAGTINRRSVWRMGISCAIFIRRNLIESGIRYNTSLGVGSGTPFGSGEETDFLLQAIERHFRIYYTPELVIGHPAPMLIYSEQQNRKVYAYGCGFGRVLRLNAYPLHQALYFFARPLGGIVVSLLQFNRRKAIYYYNSLSGRTKGYFSIQ
ncbi:glycosyltransferase family 2 protein [Cohnella sp. WQ 127256]|uniref:glycosyltransferase family 2 protein n=1 Tax=Cohnella sp. WQ 127256 TaxID=2938790 RepID=UPI002118C08D|nr:glycosyltransferase family 2 protein [Cohnella sp. WQ 127256]